ncbi:ParB/RepB/Spo0J family partition protein [Candidatus Uhrbacteria bacterium]|nr:ParB/RepB/Spo0J family partition protein [Candidatus Uhrbacteria bacterium]
MIGRQSGLGRGLGALIPQRETAEPESPRPIAGDETSVRRIPVDAIDPNPHQPRMHFEHAALEDLVSSIKEHGVLQPVVVTVKSDGRYELIVGERRLRASKIAGLETVPAIVRSATEQQKMELALIENVQRADLNPIEEARAYVRLMEEFGMTQDDVGRRVGKSRPQVANTIRLLQLPESIQHALVEKKISASNARTLLSVPSDDERLRLFDSLLAGQFTVRQTEARVGRTRQPKMADPNLAGLENRLREALGTRVTVTRDPRGEGEIRIRFYNEEDLQEIIKKISPISASE